MAEEIEPGSPQDVAEALAALLTYATQHGLYLGRRMTRRQSRGTRHAVGTFRLPNEDRWVVRWTQDRWIAERETRVAQTENRRMTDPPRPTPPPRPTDPPGPTEPPRPTQPPRPSPWPKSRQAR